MDKVYSDSYTRIHGDLVHFHAFGIVCWATLTLGHFYGVHWHRSSLVWQCELLVVLYFGAISMQFERLPLEIVSH